MTVPIAQILPLQREIRWSDLLAILIEMDPTAATALGTSAGVAVNREVSRGHVRADLVLVQEISVVVEVKVLSDLHTDQLPALQEAFPSARHVLVHPGRLDFDVRQAEGWEVLSWEEVLAPFTRTTDDWVSRTARSWLEHLDRALPLVDATTKCNDVTGTDFAGALRARMTWVHRHVQPPADVAKDIVTSGSGRSTVARLQAPGGKPGYTVMIEAEERLPVQQYPPRNADQNSVRPRGPAVRVTVIQEGVSTSRDFDWDYLYTLWRHMEHRRTGAPTGSRPTADPRPNMIATACDGSSARERRRTSVMGSVKRGHRRSASASSALASSSSPTALSTTSFALWTTQRFW